jgi:hypothetical protein
LDGVKCWICSENNHFTRPNFHSNFF